MSWQERCFRILLVLPLFKMIILQTSHLSSFIIKMKLLNASSSFLPLCKDSTEIGLTLLDQTTWNLFSMVMVLDFHRAGYEKGPRSLKKQGMICWPVTQHMNHKYIGQLVLPKEKLYQVNILQGTFKSMIFCLEMSIGTSAFFTSVSI